MTVYLADCIYLYMDKSRFGLRSRSRRDILLGAGPGAGAVPKLHGSVSLQIMQIILMNLKAARALQNQWKMALSEQVFESRGCDKFKSSVKHSK